MDSETNSKTVVKKEIYMKKILFFSHAMELGGAERALLGLLESIDTSEYDIDLFLLRHTGEMLNAIPSKIHLLPEIPQYTCLAVPICDAIKRCHFVTALNRMRGKRAALKRIAELGLGDNDVELEYSHKYTVQSMPQISDKEYDVAISFLTPHYYVTNKVIAKKKIAWIHTDYSQVQTDVESQLKMWAAYQVIVSISDKAREEFIKVFPKLKDKVTTIQNTIPSRYMFKLIDALNVESEMPNDGTFKLLSIGRFCNAKNFDNVPEICSMLIENGINVKWYLIGFGEDEQLIKNRITEFRMQNNVILLGKKSNPYPYIKNCDVYVQPSRYEGRCVSVVEAQVLNKPVIITNYATSASQLKDGYDGVIVPMDNKGCAEGIANVIRNVELRRKLIQNTKKEDYTNAKEIEKIYHLIGE